MAFIGMDVHMRTTTYCALDSEGAVLERGTIDSTEECWQRLIGKRPGTQVCFESGSWSFRLVAASRALGVAPVVVDARKFKMIALSKKKTDRRDAHVLAEALRCGLAQGCAVVMPSERARRARHLLQARSTVVKESLIARNAAMGLLRMMGVNLTRRGWESAVTWEEASKSEMVSENIRDLLNIHRSMWETSMKHRKEFDQKIAEELKMWPEAKIVADIPGFGPVVSLAVLASLDDPARFRKPQRAGSYAGLAPSVRNSGEVERHGHITRQGRNILRHVMVQAGLAAMRSYHLSPSLKSWSTRLIARRGHKIAAVAMGRRLLVLACRLLKNGEIYNPLYGAAKAA